MMIRKYYFKIIDGDKILEFNKVLILGKKIKIFSKANLSFLRTDEILKSYDIELFKYVGLKKKSVFLTRKD